MENTSKACKKCKYSAACYVSGLFKVVTTVLNGAGPQITWADEMQQFLASLPERCPQRWRYL